MPPRTPEEEEAAAAAEEGVDRLRAGRDDDDDVEAAALARAMALALALVRGEWAGAVRPYRQSNSQPFS